MCGIIGVLNLTAQEPIDVERLIQANNTLAHRGPDDSGIWAQANIGLAMRRLSIVDVPCGHQPMSNEDNTVHIVYNGEIYNHGDLRAQLEALGHRFRTNCDTEVIIHAYEQWGKDGCLSRLRGMYAFAIWDTRLQTLFLARDRMGIKPLYFAECNGRLFFASEIRGLLLCSNLSREVNVSALKAFLEIGFVTSPYTMFKDVQKLPPAHYLVAQDGRKSLHKYWDLSYDTVTSYSERDLVERFRELLAECVRMHLMGDVPLGALLSGGIDSTTVVALMADKNSGPVTTVSVGFDTPAFDETTLTIKSAGILGTKHHVITFSGDSMDDYPRALFYREEPLADATFVAMYKLFEACRQQGLTVVLTGEGADELLGGYYWHRSDAMVRPLLRLPRFIRLTLASSPFLRSRGEAGMRIGRMLRRTPSTLVERYQDWIGVDMFGLGDTLLSSDVKAGLAREKDPYLLESWAAHLTNVSHQSPLHQMLWLQSRTRMVDRINHNVDRMSMAHSIEARPAFLDHTLWELCATIPAELKLHGSFLRPIDKYLLREATRGLIPEEVRFRKKKGLSVPYARWLSRTRLPDWAETALSRAQLEQAGLFDPDAVVQLRREHQEGAPGRSTLLMGVLSVQLWRQMFIASPLACNGFSLR